MTDDPAQQDKIMRAMLDAGPDLLLMAPDTSPGIPFDPGSRISISLSGDDEATLRRYWDGLVEGGSVAMPLERAPWGDILGMCTDRFGIAWMVDIAGVPAAAR